jgi:hypothetical protein
MEVTTPLASLPYKEQIKKKQREVVQLLQQLEDVSSTIFPAVLKGIFQPFELGSVARLIRSAVINWRPGKFFFIMIQSHERSKTIFSGLKISEMTLSDQVTFRDRCGSDADPDPALHFDADPDPDSIASFTHITENHNFLNTFLSSASLHCFIFLASVIFCQYLGQYTVLNFSRKKYG